MSITNKLLSISDFPLYPYCFLFIIACRSAPYESLFLVHPTLAVPAPPPEDLFESAPINRPQSHPNARASAVFRFLPSPLHHTTVRNYETATCG